MFGQSQSVKGDAEVLDEALQRAWDVLEEAHLSLGKIERLDRYSEGLMADLYRAALAYVEVLHRIQAAHERPRIRPLDD